MIVALCGGVGGAKLALGLYRVLPPGALTVIVNTADDLQFCGLHVSPDLDTVMYTLAGLSRPDVGWGVAGDTFAALGMLSRYGAPDWFQVGDRDLATDIIRTDILRRGGSLTDAAAAMARSLGVTARILPATDDTISTRLRVADEWIEFQEYFVHRRHQVPVDAIRYDGAEAAVPTSQVREALQQAQGIVVVNSNPVLSILPILAIPAIEAALRARHVPAVAVSPIVGADAVTGPAGDLMALVGQPSSVQGVAGAYRGLVDGLIIDSQDRDRASAVEQNEGVRVLVTNTLMHSDDDKQRLASEVLTFLRLAA